MHWPDSLPPLVFSLAGDALAGGLTAAAAAYELPVAEVRIRRINTYRYQANVPVGVDAARPLRVIATGGLAGRVQLGLLALLTRHCEDGPGGHGE